MADILSTLVNRAKVRVFKPTPGSDDRNSLCGEPMQKDNGGPDGAERHFFVVPAHQADYINKAFRKYIVSEPFIPGVDNEDALGTLSKPEWVCAKCGRTDFKSLAGKEAHERTCKGLGDE